MRDPVQIASDAGLLDATLEWSDSARYVVLLVHDMGSRLFGSRDEFLSSSMLRRGYATLLVDLLTETEAEGHTSVPFDVERIAVRVRSATAWIRADERTRRLPIVLFGAGTAAAAAIVVAGDREEEVCAVISYSGEPHLAGAAMGDVHAPILFIVGGEGPSLAALHQHAYDRLRTPANFARVSGASAGFAEGTLEKVSALAAEWLDSHLGSALAPTDGMAVA